MSSAFKDYYATLGVARDASPEDIKKAFRKLARQFHPDTATDKKSAEEKFKEINEANEVLSDPEKRQKYDQLGAHWQESAGVPPQGGWQGSPGTAEQEFHFGGTGFSDFFEQYFSGGSRYGFPDDWEAPPKSRGTGQPRRGHDIEGDLLVTLDEAMHGTMRPLSLQTRNRQTGEVETHSFQVRIPPGATSGRRIRVPEKGERGINGGPAGDLYLRVRHAAHPDFSSRDADIFHDLDIAPWEAVLGAEVVVPTLDGAIKLRIPPDTENDQSLRVRNRGLPKGKTGERGDFLVRIHIVMPKQIGDVERSLWEKLRQTSSFNPRKAPKL